MKHLIGVQLLAIAFTNIILLSVSGIQLTLGVAIMVVFVGYSMIVFLYDRWKVHTYGTGLIAAYMFTVFVWRFTESRPTSIAYSALFLLFFVAMMNGLPRWFSREAFAKVMQGILIAYFLNVVCAQLLELSGLRSGITQAVFQVNIDPRYDSVRYQGFSSEPSYAAFIVIAAYIAAHRLGRLSSARQFLLAILLLYLTASFQSVYGYLMFGPALLAVHWKLLVRHRGLATAAGVIACVLLLSLPVAWESGRFGRILTGIASNDMLDAGVIGQIDNSTFIRVGTFLEYIIDADPLDPAVLFGHGAMSHMYSLGWEYRQIIGINEAFNDQILRPGFNIGFLYDYGIAGTLLVILLVFRTAVRRVFSIEAFIILMMFFNANFNTLLFWFIVTTFSACKLFEGIMPALASPVRTVKQLEPEESYAYRG